MDELTVTMPLSHYEEMKRKEKENDVSNFIKKEYSNFPKNEYKLVIDQEVVKAKYGRGVYSGF